jgi:DNA-binding IclR family transcriptional regulator
VGADLHDLVKQGLLEQDGSGRWTVYRLSEEAEAVEIPEVEAGERLTPTERHERIRQLLARQSPLPARLIAEQLGISPATVKRDSRQMIQAGEVASTATGPKNSVTMYRLLKT